MKSKGNPQEYGIVLSGGGARGLFAVQILKRLFAGGFDFSKIKYISGVSVGSIIGAMMAQGDWKILFEMFEQIKNKDVYNGKMTKWQGFKNRILGRRYILDIEPLHELLLKYISLEKAKATGIIFHIGITDLNTGEYKTYTQNDFETNEDYIRCIMASCSQPVIMEPQKFTTKWGNVINGADGGVVTISPIKSVLNCNPDKLIIINSSSSVIRDVWGLKTLESILLRTLDLAIAQSFKKDLEKFKEYNELYSGRKKAGKKYFEATIFETTLFEDSLDFDSEALKKLRVSDANSVFLKTYNP
ncbi:patatin-like phospholipase family protein [Arcicella sp. LKC2W]|uniref:patatin-like phospholipase family protein n=1 Tax=Arcicella sp. LKC2W TaxID=2984198 RepID=UPI002B1F3E92|nr:patatin-like phospholipase family protein [Arcicella sp. LKC2W]MEA5458673.1 patatin-like phospholipase family protein [Arcicella sp. LKC2W]